MKFFSGALAAVLPALLVPPAASAPTLHAEHPAGFDREFSPMPPAPGSDAVWPAAWTRFIERRDEYEESLEDGVRLSSPPALRRGIGDYKVLVLLMQFADHDVTTLPSKEDLERLFNEEKGVDPQAELVEEAGNSVNPTGSVSEVLKVNSGGALNIDFVVTDWIQMSQTEAHYASDEHGVGQQGKSKSQFEEGITEALDILAAQGFDFSPFTYIAEEDYKMHGFGVIHSGHAAEFGGSNSAYQIWSIKGSGMEWTVPGVEHGIVDRYYTTSVFHGRPSAHNQFMRFGTAVHEFGHSLGLPDLYDTTSGAGKGLGDYSVMAKGTFGFDNTGRYPTSFDPYCKLLLGWAEATLIEQSSDVVEITAGINQIYKITHGFPQGKKPEYLLLENRQPIGYDSKMNGGGIAIYHVDENKSKQNSRGYPGMAPSGSKEFPRNNKHYRVALVSSDGEYRLEEGESEGKGADMLWSATSSLTELGFGHRDDSEDTVWPNTETYQKGKVAETGIVIDNFSESGTTMTFRVQFLGAPTSDHDSQVALFTNAKQPGYLRAHTTEVKDS